MKLEILPGIKTLKTAELSSNEDVELYIPKSVEVMEFYSLTGNFGYPKRNLTVYYEGTIEEYKKILKGKTEEVVEEDFYGWYYHNSSRYTTMIIYRPWFHTDLYNYPKVYCSDGELEKSVESDEKYCREMNKEK